MSAFESIRQFLSEAIAFAQGQLGQGDLGLTARQINMDDLSADAEFSDAGLRLNSP